MIDTATTTPDVVKAMLTENTGSHFLDSGGAYGYGWQDNQRRDIADKAPTTLAFPRHGGFEVEHSAYHFLVETLEYDAEMDAAFAALAETPDQIDESWPANMLAFPAHHFDCGPGSASSEVANTYNFDNLLSQILQYVTFGWDTDEGPWVLLQVHNGCDVRGGYTRPRVFRACSEGVADFFAVANATIWCAGASKPQADQLPGLEHDPQMHWWSTDDSGTWTRCNNDGDNLEHFERHNLAADETPSPGAICVDATGKGYCPLCAAPLNVGY